MFLLRTIVVGGKSFTWIVTVLVLLVQTYVIAYTIAPLIKILMRLVQVQSYSSWLFKPKDSQQ